MATVTIPVKGNLRRESGTILIQLQHDKQPAKEHILTIGAFSLWCLSDGIQLETDKTNTNKRIHVPIVSFPGQISIIWTWAENNHRLLVLGTEAKEKLVLASALTEDFGVLDFTAQTPFFKGTYQRLECYTSDILYEPLSSIKESIDSYNQFMLSGEEKEDVFYALTSGLNNQGTVSLDALKGSETLMVDFNGGIHYEIKPMVELTLAPKDASPILVSDENGPFRRSFFFDFETGLYSTVNEEHFIYRKEDYLVLSYADFNKDYGLIIRSGEETVTLNPTISGQKVYLNLSEQEKEHFYGETISIRYQLNRSYVIEHNEDSAYDSYRLDFSNHSNREIQVVQEGNRFSNQRLAKEIELNPLVNPRHTGFLYISDAEQHTQAFRLNVSSAYVTADGIDSADILVEAIDEEGNEVLSPYIDVFAQMPDGAASSEAGTIIPIINRDTLKARITNGRCYFKYLAPVLTRKDSIENQKVYIMVYDRKAKIGTQLSVILRPTASGKRVVSGNYHSTEATPAASVPFEYFARFYERLLPEGHPLSAVDVDNDQVLSRMDWLLFEETVNNQTRMQQLAETLLESEAF